MTVGELSQWIVNSLAPTYGESEARSMSRIILEDVLNYTPVQVLMHRDTDIPDFIPVKIEKILNRILANEPIQYVMGEARFCGLTLKVTPAVLIPRPETEELVDLITKQWSNVPDVNVLDICTGSGCIAVALARSLRFPHIEAIDISPDALAVAQENAKGLKVKVTFHQTDALQLAPDHKRYDIIVSNPPYVACHERAGMPAN
ncbi:MAG: peptide chain release factor N(5)-glutamine methyltransferase, partial [Muribaculaceae bacterium]|nr:peptide chain release factor N(5)-glutamine methyltransferase [Muribaculaceae bacterium]